LAGFLGSTAEVDLALLGFKKYVERHHPKIESELDATTVVGRYFEKTRAASKVTESHGNLHARVDTVLRFGRHTVLVEHKFVSQPIDANEIEQRVVEQAAALVGELGLARAAVVLLSRGELPAVLDTVQSLQGDRISWIGVRLR